MSQLLQSNPNVTYRADSSGVVFFNHFDAFSYSAPKAAQTVFEYFRVGRAPEDATRLPIPEQEILGELRRRLMVLVGDDFLHLSRGFLSEVPPPMGEKRHFSDIDSMSPDGHAVVGCPADIGSQEGGASLGTRLVRAAFSEYWTAIADAQRSGADSYIYDFELRRRYNVAHLHLYDCGDINHDFADGSPGFNYKVHRIITELLARGVTPIVLGGDHAITLPVVSAITKSHDSLGIIHFDAHHDLYSNSFHQRNTINHGNFMLSIMKMPQVKAVHTIGCRTVEYLSEYSAERRADPRLSYTSSYELRELNSPENVFAGLPRNIPYYLTIDVDALDPVLAPETGTPVLGGLDYYMLMRLLLYVTLAFRLVAFDVVEVRRGQGGDNRAASVAARALLTILLRQQPYDQSV